MAKDVEIKGGSRLRLTYHSPDIEQPRRATVVDLEGFKRDRASGGNVEVQVLDRDGWEVARVSMPMAIMRALMVAGDQLLADPEVQSMATNDRPSGLAGMRRFIHRSQIASKDHG